MEKKLQDATMDSLQKKLAKGGNVSITDGPTEDIASNEKLTLSNTEVRAMK